MGAITDTTEKHTQPSSPIKRVFETLKDGDEDRADLLEIASGYWVRDEDDADAIAIEVERAYQYMIQNAQINQFDVGVRLVFCMFANLTNVNVKHPRKQGIAFLSGNHAWPPPADRFNSASNESTCHSCRIQTLDKLVDGFVLNGGRSIAYYNSCVEGLACRYCWNLEPRLANATVRLVDSWCEFPKLTEDASSVAGMIRWAGKDGSTLIVDGFRGWRQKAIWIDATDARDSTIEIRGMGLDRGDNPPLLRVPESVEVNFDERRIDSRTFYKGVNAA